jgi:hypothetical protein
MGKNVWREKMSGGTKHPGEKHLVGQNICRDKTFGGTKRPATEWLGEQNIRGDKISVGKNVRQEKKSLWSVGELVLTAGKNVRGKKTSGKEKSPLSKLT